MSLSVTPLPPNSEPNIKPKAVHEWALLLVLAGAQFSHILDFVIMMPLGPQFMRVLEISPRQFGFLVSIYTFTAALCGFLGTFFIDRFDRKTALVGLMIGFTVGTFFCAVSSTYEFLLAARAVAGAFGGLMGAVVFSIIGDAFIENRRGMATGTVMSAFSLASVLGVPFGLYLATHYTWQAPFFLLALLSTFMVVVAFRVLPSMRRHLENRQSQNLKESLKFLVLDSNRVTAYVLITSMMFGAFSVIPFMSPYLVKNVGFAEHHLPYMYLSGGIFTLLTSRLIGRIADRFGKQKTFTVLATLSIVPILVITHLPPAPVAVAIAATTTFTILVAGRAIPAMSLITSSVASHNRGSFMSFTTAIQQLASGFASLAAGQIIAESADGKLLRYGTVGLMATGATLLGIWLANRLKIVAD